MDVHVIDVEGMGHRTLADDGDAESNEGGEANTAENSTVHDDEDGISEPYVGMEFDSEDAAKSFYDEYARRLGFNSKVGQSSYTSRSKPDGTVIAREFVCGREGLKRRHGDTCEAMLRVELRGQEKWLVTKFVKEHSHAMVSPSKVHYLRPRRHFAGTAKNVAEAYQGAGTVPSGVMFVSMDGNRGPVEKNRVVRNSHPVESNRYAEDGAITIETYSAAMNALRDGGKKVAIVKKSVAKVPPPTSQASGTGYDDRKNSMIASDATPLLWPRQDEVLKRFNLNDAGAPVQSDLNLPRMAPVSLHRDDGTPENMVVLPCLKSMTWVMENKNSSPGNRVAVINLKLQDYSRTPSAESEVKFQLSRVSLEPMLRSMAYISEQLSTPANKVAVINLKLQDTETTSGESEVKFQVSRDTLGAMLRSMAYIREQLSNPVSIFYLVIMVVKASPSLYSRSNGSSSKYLPPISYQGACGHLTPKCEGHVTRLGNEDKREKARVRYSVGK
ncbi:hypothetical protein TIFTF001_016178 [Ficus carica]|uniref:FAR1 domain-containing protein n=1 Tax=Ficus carica TaxID=3494 RepID=A0AA88AJ15_FICCA|nr:hypothetical protein TIFTF001_016178 [Ficus carica]